MRAEARHVFSQLPSNVAVDAPVVESLASALTARQEATHIQGVTAWTDAAILNGAGIPAICFGPGDMGLAHADEEWVDMREIERATSVLECMVPG